MVNHGVRVVFAEVSAVCGFGTPLGRLLKLLWFPHKAYCASLVPLASAPGVPCPLWHQPAKFSCNFLLFVVLRGVSLALSEPVPG